MMGFGSGETYVKPLIRLNSLTWMVLTKDDLRRAVRLTILPPWSLTCCLALSSSSVEASFARVI
jgi:hypothetical protein